MKPLAFLCTLVLCLSLAACAQTPSAGTTVPTTAPTAASTTVPPNPTTKTVYVHTSVTSTSDTMDARTDYLYDFNNCLTEVIQYSGTTQTQRYTVSCDENDNFIRWEATVGPLELYIEYAYDEQGNKLGNSLYQSGELMSQTVYTLENGVHTDVLSIMPAQNREIRTQYTYNSQGTRVREDHLLNNVLLRYGIYTTDNQGRVASISFYQADGTAHSTVSYSYDGLTETQIAKNAAGEIQQKTVTTYDDHGNLLCKQVYDGQNTLVSTETHTWMAITVPFDCPRASA